VADEITSRERTLAREILAAVAQQVDQGGALKAATVGTVALALARYRVELDAARAEQGAPADVAEVASLSQREREVVNGLRAGVRPSDIAKRLCVSRFTVRNHLKHAFLKLGVHSQVELLSKLGGHNGRG
jgi:DNA-binding CsgD family transcriptional regulator